MRLLLAFAFALIALPAFAAQTITWEKLAPATGPAVVIDAAAPRLGEMDVSDFDGSPEDLELHLEDMELMRSMQQEGGRLNAGLDGEKVRIAGYITPLAFDDENVDEFLFVPFLGACIHVPPPEANQIIHVRGAKGVKAADVWQPMWLEGTLRAKPVGTVLADVGYRMESALVAPYDGTAEIIEDPVAVD